MLAIVNYSVGDGTDQRPRILKHYTTSQKTLKLRSGSGVVALALVIGLGRNELPI